MNICYTLTSPCWDMYAKMLYVSVSCLKRLHPDATVLVFADELGAKTIRNSEALSGRELFELIIVRKAMGEEPIARSRFLKTMLRQWVHGDYLYLDVDTLPLRPFDRLFKECGSVAAARETEMLDPQLKIPGRIKPIFAANGWRTGLRAYYNAGVHFVRDNKEGHAFATEYHRRWAQTLRNGWYNDQPAFNSAIDELDLASPELDSRYNAIVRDRPSEAKRGCILHFCASNLDFHTTIMGYLINRVVEPPWSINWEAIDRCVSGGHPWGPPYLPHLLWRSHNYGQAVFALPRHPTYCVRGFRPLLYRISALLARQILPKQCRESLKRQLLRRT